MLDKAWNKFNSGFMKSPEQWPAEGGRSRGFLKWTLDLLGHPRGLASAVQDASSISTRNGICPPAFYHSRNIFLFQNLSGTAKPFEMEFTPSSEADSEFL